MPDRIFDEPQLAELYDALESDRTDLDAYLSIVHEGDARSVADIGCGTGTFACLLANAGFEVVAADPAAAMLAVARRKAGAHLVRWVHGMATDLHAVRTDLATMTGNVAQVFLDDDEWAETLLALQRVLRVGGALVFEARRPEREAWVEWNPVDSYQCVEVEGLGEIESWHEVTDVTLPFVTFRNTMVFNADGTTVTSESTLRFRSGDELAGSLEAAGFRVDEVREAPDRLGKELVFLATRL